MNTASAKIFPEGRRYIGLNLKKISQSLPVSVNTIEIKGQDSLKKTNFSYHETFIYVHPAVFILPFGIALFILIRRFLRRKK